MAGSAASTKYDKSIKAVAKDAIKHIRSGQDKITIGFGSGRAATAVTKEITALVKKNNDRYNIVGVPTSLQIKLVIEEESNDAIPLISADQADKIDIVFDGADQIDADGYVVKGGGGALLRENILFNMADTIVVMADETKFTKFINRAIPVEIHALSRSLVQKRVAMLGGMPSLRLQKSGYPIFTENGNIILDCSFGTIQNPKKLTASIKQIPGVVESGIFAKKPDVIYKAGINGTFKETRTKKRKI